VVSRVEIVTGIEEEFEADKNGAGWLVVMLEWPDF
jgi:hypothetical protein